MKTLTDDEAEKLNGIAYAYRCARREHPDEVVARFNELIAYIEQLRGIAYDEGCDYYYPDSNRV